MSDDDKIHIGALYLKLEEAGNIIGRLQDENKRLQQVIKQLRTDNTRLRHSNDTSDR